ncbi:(+)-neomenthol dehydrogenase [Eucalyptus grandis]|nr:(+)-neomenthol dehydrogenase [Eucalyptus grandis]
MAMFTRSQTQMESREQEPPSLSPALSIRWWSKETVAVVTGANKGIGFALVKKLAHLGLTVVLTARDDERGGQAAESLRAQGLVDVHFSVLDVSDPVSIDAFVSWFRNHFTALDILVNNAAVSFNDIHENSVDNAELVVKTNFYGSKLLTEALLPMFRRSPSIGRILNVSSRLGSVNKVRNPNMGRMLQGEDLTEEHIEAMVGSFLEDVRKGTWKSQGWPEVWTDYAVSKLALNAYTKVLATRYDGCGLSANCFCPGFTQTSMTGGKGTRTADEAAEVGATIALLPPENLPTGKFFMGCNPVINSKL